MGTAGKRTGADNKKSIRITAAEAVMRSLEELGVKYIFGYPGGAVLPLYAALQKSRIQHILVRHEQAAAHAADGFARVTGRTGVCLATSGPGACNLVTGLATAYMDSVPLVAFTGQVATGYVGTDAFQEVDITGITMPITKHNYLVKNAQELPRVIGEAFHIASTGRPGPVLIDIPKNVAETEIDFSGIPSFTLRGYRPTYKGHNQQIVNAVKMILRSQKPVIYAGGGIIRSGAEAELQKLAELLQVPVTVTLSALGSFPAKHELSLGMLGIHGSSAANLAVSKCDCLIALGSRFDERVTNDLPKFAPQASVIHVDIDPAEIGKNRAVNLPIVGDLRSILRDMLPLAQKALQEKTDDYQKERLKWLEQIKKWQKKYPYSYDTIQPQNKDLPEENKTIKPQLVIKELADRTSGQAVLAVDVGQHQMWTAQYYPFALPRTFISSCGLGTMGYALPAAVGASFGTEKKKKIYVVTGDGGFQMNMAELATAAENNLPLVILIINNGRLNLVRQLQDTYYQGNQFAVEFSLTPAFEKLGDVFGFPSYSVNDLNELTEALKAAERSEGPVLINCFVDKDENVEPMLLSGIEIEEQ